MLHGLLASFQVLGSMSMVRLPQGIQAAQWFCVCSACPGAVSVSPGASAAFLQDNHRPRIIRSTAYNSMTISSAVRDRPVPVLYGLMIVSLAALLPLPPLLQDQSY